MNLILQPLEREHLSSLAELEKICFSQPWSYQSLEEELSNDTACFFTALDGEKVIGYIGLFIVCESCFVSNIAVYPEYRRKGVATALIERACDCAQAHGTEFISLEVRRSNEQALALYRQLGFRKMGVRKNYYRNPPEDALIMTKLFDETDEGMVNQ